MRSKGINAVVFLEFGVVAMEGSAAAADDGIGPCQKQSCQGCFGERHPAILAGKGPCSAAEMSELRREQQPPHETKGSQRKCETPSCLHARQRLMPARAHSRAFQRGSLETHTQKGLGCSSFS